MKYDKGKPFQALLKAVEVCLRRLLILMLYFLIVFSEKSRFTELASLRMTHY